MHDANPMERSRSRVRHAIAVTKHVQDNQGWKINHRVSPDMHDNPGSDPPLLNTRGGGLARANERAQVGGGAHLSGEGDTRDRSGERNYGKITAAVVTSCAFTRTVLIFCVSLSPLLPPCSSAYNPMLHVLSLCLSL